MLSRAHRLTSSAGFTRTMRAGTSARTRTVVVHLGVADPSEAAHGDGEPGGRAGVAVSKAIGNAVHRNLVKRRLRHLLAERINCFPRSTTLVVRALPAAGTASFGALRSDLDAALGRLRVETRP